ncbi:MAG: imidazoleglycerol-phosphate dehydratase HisB [Thermodesulfobacteriota bacterium]
MRNGKIERSTKETDISLDISVDGSGKNQINTPVPFLDHMLTLFSVHGFFDLNIEAKGDVEIDDHHTVEDIGICLGKAFGEALGEKSGINRYGMSYLPMDETLVRVVLDLSNRPYLHFGVVLADEKVGRFDTALCKEFLRAFAFNAGITLHVDLIHGENSHHIIEAVFKGLARALNEASAKNDALSGALSSKGLL